MVSSFHSSDYPAGREVKPRDQPVLDGERHFSPEKLRMERRSAESVGRGQIRRLQTQVGLRRLQTILVSPRRTITPALHQYRPITLCHRQPWSESLSYQLFVQTKCEFPRRSVLL